MACPRSNILVLAVVALVLSVESTKAQKPVAVNRSSPTACAEEDNVNVPLSGRRVQRFRVTATHPRYDVGQDNCAADFSGCATLALRSRGACQAIWDDGVTIVGVCTEPEWWRPSSMTVRVGERSAVGHWLVIYRKVEGEASWPQFAVLYEDGNLRLIPHPPAGRAAVCFGSSVIVGPAVPGCRPFVDVEQVTVDPASLCADITFGSGETARVCFSVNRTEAVATVDVGYDTMWSFATFRSMWVADGNSDVDHVETKSGSVPIFSPWTSLKGPRWYFHRITRSKHNTSAPDMRVEVMR